MLLHRYHDLDTFGRLDIETGLQLCQKAIEKERDDRIFLQWIAQLPAMALAGKTMSLQEYKDQVTGANIDMRPTSEIMAELDEIEKSFGEEGDHGT